MTGIQFTSIYDKKEGGKSRSTSPLIDPEPKVHIPQEMEFLFRHSQIFIINSENSSLQCNANFIMMGHALLKKVFKLLQFQDDIA